MNEALLARAKKRQALQPKYKAIVKKLEEEKNLKQKKQKTKEI